MFDPIYNTDCIVGAEQSDETIFFRLINRPSLSYSLHKDLLNQKTIFKTIKDINDSYHSDDNRKDFLTFCMSRTIFTNLPKKYIFLDSLRRGAK